MVISELFLIKSLRVNSTVNRKKTIRINRAQSRPFCDSSYKVVRRAAALCDIQCAYTAIASLDCHSFIRNFRIFHVMGSPVIGLKSAR